LEVRDGEPPLADECQRPHEPADHPSEEGVRREETLDLVRLLAFATRADAPAALGGKQRPNSVPAIPVSPVPRAGAEGAEVALTQAQRDCRLHPRDIQPPWPPPGVTLAEWSACRLTEDAVAVAPCERAPAGAEVIPHEAHSPKGDLPRQERVQRPPPAC